MGYRFEPDEPLAQGVRRIAREEIDGALAVIALPEPDSGVHIVRKAFKKLRALVRLAPFDGDRDLRRTYAGTARTISDLRDAKVLSDAADALAEAGIPSARQALDLPSAAERTAAANAALAELKKPLRAFRVDVATWPLGTLTFDDLLPGVARAYQRGRKRMRIARAEPTTARLHEWRKRAKDLWYHARLLLPGDEEFGHPFAADLDLLSDLLGSDHDLAVLWERLHGKDGLKAARYWIAERREALQAEAFEIGDRVYGREAFVDWFRRESHVGP